MHTVLNIFNLFCKHTTHHKHASSIIEFSSLYDYIPNLYLHFFYHYYLRDQIYYLYREYVYMFCALNLDA